MSLSAEITVINKMICFLCFASCRASFGDGPQKSGKIWCGCGVGVVWVVWCGVGDVDVVGCVTVWDMGVAWVWHECDMSVT